MATDGPVFVVGDSNAVALGAAARAAGRPFRGGPLGSGRNLEMPFYRIEQGDFVLTGQSRAPLVDEYRSLLRHDGPILSCVGFNSHRLAGQLHGYCAGQGAAHWSELWSDQVMRQLVADSRAVALTFYRDLAAHDRKVYFIHSPQRVPPHLVPLLRDIEQRLIPLVQATGARLVDVRAQIAGDAGLLPQYAHPGDKVHANAAMGAVALAALDRLRAQGG